MSPLILALMQLVGFVVAPPLLVLGTIVAWFRLIRLIGPRNTLRRSVQISRIRYRQPLRGIFSNAPGGVLILSGSIIALCSWALRSNPHQLRAPLAALALGMSWRFFRTASNPALPVMLLATSSVVCFYSNDLIFFWAVIVFLGVLGCVAVESTLQSTLPPVILFLGVSSYEQFQTLKRVQKTLPCLVVTLINQAEDSILRHYHRHYGGMGLDPTGTRYESLRTREGRWEQTVLDMMNMVPIVILDTRVVSEPVVQEAVWMLQPERLHKVTFVTDDDTIAPVLESILPRDEIDRTHRARLVTEAGLGDRIERLTKSRDSLPAPPPGGVRAGGDAFPSGP